MTVNNKEENSDDFCLEFVQEFGLIIFRPPTPSHQSANYSQPHSDSFVNFLSRISLYCLYNCAAWSRGRHRWKSIAVESMRPGWEQVNCSQGRDLLARLRALQDLLLWSGNQVPLHTSSPPHHPFSTPLHRPRPALSNPLSPPPLPSIPNAPPSPLLLSLTQPPVPNPESSSWIIEDQAFSPPCDLAPSPSSPSPPLP